MKRIVIVIVMSLTWSIVLQAQSESTMTPDDVTPTTTETGLQVQLTDDVVAQLAVDGESVLIGEPFTMTLMISTIPGISIDNWPELPNDPLVFEVLDAADVEEIQVDGRVE
ncbi:hypothetical protein KC957_00985, partial [Candidatus Saccharibacteria bacterium]|nr:hypothetical protein [Candidatus Saccharibacteria bacterium]